MHKPKLSTQVVVFIDVLGFREAMKESAKDPKKSNKLLIEYDEVIGNAVREILDPKNPRNALDPKDPEDNPQWNYRGFTDNFVVSIPIEGPDGEMELGRATMLAAEFQLKLATQGWFARGGITIGDFYIDDQIIFGPALVEAYTVESQLARDPRIALSETAQKVLMYHTSYYGGQPHAPQNSAVLVDADGLAFINYLHSPIGEDEDFDTVVQIIENHKAQVIHSLKNQKKSPPIWAKYRWVASYHNYFCETWLSQCASKLKIPATAFENPPHRLI